MNQDEWTTVSTEFSTVPAAVEAIARGEVVIVMDAEDRENEGDFICAAEKATPEIVNFMIHGRGQLCMPVLPDVCERLDLTPMVEIQHRAAEDRLHDAGRPSLGPDGHHGRGAVAGRSGRSSIPAAARSDFVRPGHLHPLVAKEGGVLRRAGHTEAAVDLARMAGLTPAGVLCEILDDDGDRATRERPDAAGPASTGLEIITIEQLIAHRRVSEKLVNRCAEANLPTRFGHVPRASSTA